MIEAIEKPTARARVTWSPPDANGRASGPPTATVYAATCTFVFGADASVAPGWPQTAQHFSILVQKESQVSSMEWICVVGFLSPDLVLEYVHSAARFLLMEGLKVVAVGDIIHILV